MKGLFSRTKTIRELKAIVRNLSVNFKKIDREFSKLLGIYCSWSRMNKAELTKVVDWFLSNYCLSDIIENGFSFDDYARQSYLIGKQLGLGEKDSYIASELMRPNNYHAFRVCSITIQDDFEDQYFDQYVYDENGISVIKQFEPINRGIGNRTKKMTGFLIGIGTLDDHHIVLEVEKKPYSRKSQETNPFKVIDHAVRTYYRYGSKLVANIA